MASRRIDDELLGLLRAVKEAPFEELPRLILADWLTDHDDLRGELIRIQCELPKLPYSDPTRRKLLKQEKRLLKEYGDSWTGGPEAGAKVRFRRGLLHVTFATYPNVIVDELKYLFEQGWVETTKLVLGTLHDIKFGSHPLFAEISQLDLSSSYLPRDVYEPLLEAPSLQNLVSLDLGYRHYPYQSLLRVARSQLLPQLQYVPRDCDNRLGYLRRLFRKYPDLRVVDFSTETLGEHEPDLSRIVELPPEQFPGLINLSGQKVNLDPIVQHPGARNLRALILNESHLGRDGIVTLVRSKQLRELEVLDLGANSLDDDEAVLLAEQGRFSNLVYLQLEYNNIGDEGLIALSNSEDLESLALLDFGPNRIGDAGVTALAQSKSLKNLELLSLWGNLVGDAGLTALMNSPNVSKLRELYIGNNQLTDAGVNAALESPSLSQIRILRFENNTDTRYNEITSAMRKKLKERFGDGVEVNGIIS
jgi:uncharacterized protein (TIGR02996 family)